MASPMHPAAQRQQAVVSPVTSLRWVMRIVPVPRKPMPETTCAPKRTTSVRFPTALYASFQQVSSIRLRYWLRIEVAAAAMATSM